MLIILVCIMPKCFLIHIIAEGFFLIGLKFSHLKLGLFNYNWIRHRSVYCGAALKARFFSYLVVVSSRTVNQAQSPELVVSILEAVQAPLETRFCAVLPGSQFLPDCLWLDVAISSEYKP